jgi:hypothetical protein
MITHLLHLFRLLPILGGGPRDLALENLALRRAGRHEVGIVEPTGLVPLVAGSRCRVPDGARARNDAEKLPASRASGERDVMSVPCSTAEVSLPSFLPAQVMVVFLSQFETV